MIGDFLLGLLYNPAPVETISLSGLLHEQIQELHTRVSEHVFVKKLLKEEISETSYQQYLVDLKHVYAALEKELTLNKENSCIQPIYFEKLFRAQSIERDLSHPQYFKEQLSISQAAIDYAAHLETLGRLDPIGLAAHSYIRYLGDLSGGAILKKHVDKKWPGVDSFYCFTELLVDYPAIKGTYQFKMHYKAKIDQLALSNQQIDLLVKEAKLAFEYSEKMLDAIPLDVASTIN